jgi:hypothetical protein
MTQALDFSASVVASRPTARQASRSRTTEWLLLAGATGALLFPAVALVEGATRPGYNAWTHYVSELSLSDQGWMQIANFVACGLLIVAGAVGLARALPAGPGSTWGPRLVGLFGVSLVLAGVFVTDPLHGYPADAVASASHTVHGMIHGLNGAVCFSALAAAGGVFARYFAGRSRRWAVASLLVGILVPVLFVATQASSVLSDTGVLADAPTGVLQRITIVGGWSWLALLTLHAWNRFHADRP